MTTTQRFTSLSVMAALAFALAPITSAAGFAELDDATRSAVRSALQTCRESSETREAAKVCAQGIAEQYGIELPHRRGRRGRVQNLSEEVREELRECKEDNETREQMRACAEQVAAKHGIELPKKHGPKRFRGARRAFQNIPEDQREAVKEQLRACRDEETFAEKRACMRNVLEAYQN